MPHLPVLSAGDCTDLLVELIGGNWSADADIRSAAQNGCTLLRMPKFSGGNQVSVYPVITLVDNIHQEVGTFQSLVQQDEMV